MMFENPKIEFIPLDVDDIISTSGGGGAGVDICAPGNPNDESDFPCYGNAGE